MKRILCIISSMNLGGAETFLMKVYRNIDRDNYQMDFCVVEKENYYASEIKELGGRIFNIPLKSRHPFASLNAIRKIVRDNRFEYVIRINEHSLSTLDLLAAKFGGASRTIMRSSNAESGGGVSSLLHKCFWFMPRIIPDVKIAPSKLAAEYTFGKKMVKKGGVQIINNGLNLKQFEFDENERMNLRKQLKIEDKFVVGHVGRFSKQKNHEYLIDIFEEIKKKKNNAVLLLIGNGDLLVNIKQKVLEKGLGDSVVFMGLRNDVPKLLSTMDVFVFPSFYEGMPNTVIEAQTSGLPCVISDSITSEAKVTEIVEEVSLSNPPSIWACKTLELCGREKKKRIEYSKEMYIHGYDIKTVAKEFVESIFG